MAASHFSIARKYHQTVMGVVESLLGNPLKIALDDAIFVTFGIPDEENGIAQATVNEEAIHDSFAAHNISTLRAAYDSGLIDQVTLPPSPSTKGKRGRPRKDTTNSLNHPDRAGKKMIHAPIFFKHRPESNLIWDAMRHTHIHGKSIDGDGLEEFLRGMPYIICCSAYHSWNPTGQVRQFREEVFEYLMPRISELVKKHGGHQKWGRAGETYRREVWYSIICNDPITVAHGVFTHVINVVPFEEWFARHEDEDVAPYAKFTVYTFGEACEHVFKYGLCGNVERMHMSFESLCTGNHYIKSLDLPKNWLDMPTKAAGPLSVANIATASPKAKAGFKRASYETKLVFAFHLGRRRKGVVEAVGPLSADGSWPRRAASDQQRDGRDTLGVFAHSINVIPSESWLSRAKEVMHTCI